MAPKPADRPTAREVLQSDLLPPRVQDEQLKDLLRSLPDNPVAYERVVDSLFAISDNKDKQAAAAAAAAAVASSASALGAQSNSSSGPAGTAAVGDPGAALSALVEAGLLVSQGTTLSLGELPGAPLDSHLQVEEAVTKVVRDVCSVHGAVQMSSTDLGLSHVGLPKDAAKFLAPSGVQVRNASYCCDQCQ